MFHLAVAGVWIINQYYRLFLNSKLIDSWNFGTFGAEKSNVKYSKVQLKKRVWVSNVLT